VLLWCCYDIIMCRLEYSTQETHNEQEDVSLELETKLMFMHGLWLHCLVVLAVHVHMCSFFSACVFYQ